MSKDEPIFVEAILLMVHSSSSGGGDNVVTLSSELEGMIRVLEEAVSAVGKPVVPEGRMTRMSPLVLQRTKRLAQEVLPGMERVIRMIDPMYDPSGTPSSVEVTASKVGFEIGE